MRMQRMNENIAMPFQKYPAVAKLCEKERKTKLADYLGRIGHSSLTSIMPLEDLTEEVESYFATFFNREIASKAAKVIGTHRCLSTANHHHFAFEYMTVQETMLYDMWLMKQTGGSFADLPLEHSAESPVVPFFAASNLNLTNTLYPRGMIVYDCSLPKGSLRIPLYPWKLKRQCVATLDGISSQMVAKAKERIGKEVVNGTISRLMGDSLDGFCNAVLLSNDVLKYSTLREQTTIVNSMISQRYFKDRSPLYLWMPLETLATRLLIRDLRHEDGILYNILFCDELRVHILQNLNGVSGCWTEDTGGTHFFWGLDSRHVLFPLKVTEKNGEAFLNGMNSLEEEVNIPFTKEAVLEELDKLRLLPGLFLCFLEIHFLRDFTVFGGYYQPTYLGQMSNGLVKSLRELKIFENEASIIESKKNYMTLGLTYFFRENHRGIYPVSTAELLEEPISLDELEGLMDITIEDSLNCIAF